MRDFSQRVGFVKAILDASSSGYNFSVWFDWKKEILKGNGRCLITTIIIVDCLNWDLDLGHHSALERGSSSH